MTSPFLINQATPVVSATRAVHRVCDVCEEAASKYTCPQCHLRYCCVGCYRVHSDRCTARFDTGNVAENMKTVQHASREMRTATQDILLRESEARQEDSRNHEDSERLAAIEALHLTLSDPAHSDLSKEELKSLLANHLPPHLHHEFESLVTAAEEGDNHELLTNNFFSPHSTTPFWEMQSEEAEEIPIGDPSFVCHRSMPCHLAELMLSFAVVYRVYDCDETMLIEDSFAAASLAMETSRTLVEVLRVDEATEYRSFLEVLDEVVNKSVLLPCFRCDSEVATRNTMCTLFSSDLMKLLEPPRIGRALEVLKICFKAASKEGGAKSSKSRLRAIAKKMDFFKALSSAKWAEIVFLKDRFVEDLAERGCVKK